MIDRCLTISLWIRLNSPLRLSETPGEPVGLLRTAKHRMREAADVI